MSRLMLPTLVPDWAAAQHAEILAILGRIQKHVEVLEKRMPVSAPEPNGYRPDSQAWD